MTQPLVKPIVSQSTHDSGVVKAAPTQESALRANVSASK